MHVFGGRQEIKSDQANRQSLAGQTWYAKNEDTIDSFGIGVQSQLIEDKLDAGADYVMSRSTGKVNVDAGVVGGTFPELKTDLDTVKLYASYRLKDNMTLRAEYWYEDYNSKDWMLDGVDPATISDVLSLGEDSPDYTVHALMLSLRYRF